MNYVRTKDGKILDIGNIDLPYLITGNIIDFNSQGRFEIIEQANTIEELCDEFVIKAYIDSYPRVFHNVNLKEINMFKEKDTIVYGAIWNEKGLIYIAKMNDKGELELL